MKNAQKAANTSNTAGSVLNVGSAFAAMSGIMSGLTALVALGAIGNRAAGKLMASPAFARWLVPTIRSQSGLQKRLDTLPRIAAANPAIEGEIGAFMRASNDNLARAAAKGDGGENQRPSP